MKKVSNGNGDVELRFREYSLSSCRGCSLLSSPGQQFSSHDYPRRTKSEPGECVSRMYGRRDLELADELPTRPDGEGGGHVVPLVGGIYFHEEVRIAILAARSQLLHRAAVHPQQSLAIGRRSEARGRGESTSFFSVGFHRRQIDDAPRSFPRCDRLVAIVDVMAWDPTSMDPHNGPSFVLRVVVVGRRLSSLCGL